MKKKPSFIEAVIPPNEKEVEKYNKKYEKFKKLYPMLKEFYI